MKKDEKIQLVREDVIEQLKVDQDINRISALIFAQFDDIKIIEVANLVKEIGREEGLIASPKELREKAEEVLESRGTEQDWNMTHDELHEVIQRIHEESGASLNFCTNLVKMKLRSLKIDFPNKKRAPKRGGWRAALAQGVADGLSGLELVEAVEPYVKSRKVAEDYTRDFAWMIRLALDLSK